MTQSGAEGVPNKRRVFVNADALWGLRGPPSLDLVNTHDTLV